jgi:hypothetical protein
VYHAPRPLQVVHGDSVTIHGVLAYAYEGLPIVIMVDSGGAASAIFDYCNNGGIQAVDSNFAGDELALRVIKTLNDKYDQNQLNFFQLDVRRPGSQNLPLKEPQFACARDPTRLIATKVWCDIYGGVLARADAGYGD